MCLSVHVRPGYPVDQHDALQGTRFPDLVRRKVDAVSRQLVNILQPLAKQSFLTGNGWTTTYSLASVADGVCNHEVAIVLGEDVSRGGGGVGGYVAANVVQWLKSCSLLV